MSLRALGRLPIPRLGFRPAPTSLRALHTTPSVRRTPLVPPRSPTPPRAAPHTPPGAAGGEPVQSAGKRAYKMWYGELFPAMIPILLLSTAIFLALSLTRTHLSGHRELAEKSERVALLEAQVARMRTEAKRRQEREQRERERILPIVVERVLQHVGAMEPEAVEEEELLV